MKRRTPRPEILIVDDEASVREGLRAVLELEGYAVSMCSSGAALAARTAHEARPSVVILDLSLRDMSGGQCLRLIRASSWAEVPVLIFSGWGHVERFGLDADAIVGKTMDPETVVGAINRLTRVGRKRGSATRHSGDRGRRP